MNPPLLQSAITAHQQGNLAEAAGLYEQVLLANPNDADALNLLGSLYHAQGRGEDGANLLLRAIQTDNTNPLSFFNLGLVYFDHRKYGEAAGAFRQAAERAPTRGDFWLALGRSYVKAGLYEAATATFNTLCDLMPTNANVWLESGYAFDTAGDLAGARRAAERALSLCYSAGNPALRHQCIGLITALDAKAKAPERQWDWAYLQLQIAPDDAEGWVTLARIALTHSENLLADAMLARAQEIEPRRLDIRWLRTFNIALPIYASQQQIEEQVARYTKSVTALLDFTRNIPSAYLQNTADLLDIAHPLFLAYTGVDVRAAQQVTGQLLFEIMSRSCGETPILSSAERAAIHGDGKIHLAIVSETFFYHSNMKLRRSWLARLDRSKYHITCYHVGKISDPYTQQIRDMVDVFHHMPGDFTGMLNRLRADAPDIIQYTNIGLKALTIKLAALRLAPVQCTTWGHPITSGLPTIDYFLSSELMEPANGADHYSEKLILLPGLSVVPQPIFNDRTFVDLPRAHFGLQDDDIIYICLQSVQKYLPQYDDIYAAIAAKVPQAKFVFIQHAENAAIMDLFKLRLRAPFYAAGLDPEKHLIFLPFQEQEAYRSLNKIADITLDSLGWSGANTTFEALELGGLVMTYEGGFMRARHTSACLNLMDVPELITRTVPEYIALAIALGKDPYARTGLRNRLQAALPKLHADPGVGERLNTFYAEALQSAGDTSVTLSRAFVKQENGTYRRDYGDYDTYVEHQKTKLDFVDLADYDAKFSAALAMRLREHRLVQRGQSALCLGARVGSECKAFIENGAFTVGIDLNPGPSNQYVMVGDFHALQFADASIDIAYTNCIDHSFDHEKMMVEIRRVLKPGGIFIADIMNGLQDTDGWKPDDYDCVFWDKIDDIIAVLAQHLQADITLQTTMKNTAGWDGKMVVFKKR